MLGVPQFDQLVAQAPENQQTCPVDWQGYQVALSDAGYLPEQAQAACWCVFGTRNIEALIDGPGLCTVFPDGLVVSAGKRKLGGRGVKWWGFPFSQCRSAEPTETADDRGFGKYCIDFYGPGSVGLGRLEWRWKAKRFRDNRPVLYGYRRGARLDVWSNPVAPTVAGASPGLGGL